jgi:hypothetical protein
MALRHLAGANCKARLDSGFDSIAARSMRRAFDCSDKKVEKKEGKSHSQLLHGDDALAAQNTGAALTPIATLSAIVDGMCHSIHFTVSEIARMGFYDHHPRLVATVVCVGSEVRFDFHSIQTCKTDYGPLWLINDTKGKTSIDAHL